MKEEDGKEESRLHYDVEREVREREMSARWGGYLLEKILMQLWLLFESFPAAFPSAIRLFRSGISKRASLSRNFFNK